MKQIIKFTFDKAQYVLEDNEGQTVRLKMNYADNSYEIEGGESEIARRVAIDLLKKKHAVNFAYKFAEYTLE